MDHLARYFVFCGELSESRVDRFVERFTSVMNSEDSPRGRPDKAYVMLHSEGGHTTAGLALHGFLAARAESTTVFNMGCVCSAAALAFLAIPLEKRLMAEHAVFMVHSVRTEVEGRVSLPELEDITRKVRLHEVKVREIVTRNTKITEAEWDDRYGLEHWFDRVDSVSRGFVARVGGFQIPKESKVHSL